MVNPENPRYTEQFQRLLRIMNELREQCPWDKKQTLESIRYLSIEEVYELSDAILTRDLEEVKKELGDLFLHIVFYAKIASETQDFDIGDVLEGICEKLIRRHPHIYGEISAEDEETVKRNWEKIKLEEKSEKGHKQTVLGGVPKSLPALEHHLRRFVYVVFQNLYLLWLKPNEFKKKHEELVLIGKMPTKFGKRFRKR